MKISLHTGKSSLKQRTAEVLLPNLESQMWKKILGKSVKVQKWKYSCVGRDSIEIGSLMDIRGNSKIQLIYLNSTLPHMPVCIPIVSSTREVEGSNTLISKYHLEGKRKETQIGCHECQQELTHIMIEFKRRCG